LKVTGEKWSIIYKRTPIRLTADLSSETIGMSVEWQLKLKEKKSCQPYILSPGKPFFKNEGEIKTFLDKQRLKEFVAKRHTLQ